MHMPEQRKDTHDRAERSIVPSMHGRTERLLLCRVEGRHNQCMEGRRGSFIAGLGAETTAQPSLQSAGQRLLPHPCKDKRNPAQLHRAVAPTTSARPSMFSVQWRLMRPSFEMDASAWWPGAALEACATCICVHNHKLAHPCWYVL